MTASTSFTIKNVPTTASAMVNSHAEKLVEKLVRAAGQRNRHAVGLERGRNGGVHVRVREKAEHQHARDAADAMHAEDIQRIVIAKNGFDFRHRQVADDTGRPARCKRPPEC